VIRCISLALTYRHLPVAGRSAGVLPEPPHATSTIVEAAAQAAAQLFEARPKIVAGENFLCVFKAAASGRCAGSSGVRRLCLRPGADPGQPARNLGQHEARRRLMRATPGNSGRRAER
jgi:hypothetical protein